MRRAHRPGRSFIPIGGINLDCNWSINLDVNKVQIRSDVFMAGAQISRVKLDAVLFGAGTAYRF